MMKKYIVCIAMLCAAAIVSAQDIAFDKDNFKDKKDEFKEVKKEYDAGMDYVKEAEKYTDPSASALKNFETVQVSFYRNAKPHFEKAYAFNPNSSVVNYHLGKCHLASHDKYGASDFFVKAYQLNPNVAPDVQFFIGYSYHLKMNWAEAKKNYELYKNKATAQNDFVNQEMALKKLMECTYGEKLTQQPVRVWIDNMGYAINTEYPEYAPLITADESLIIFTSRRKDTQGGKIYSADGLYFEDVYEAAKNTSGKWEQSRNIGTNINTDEHDAPAGLSPDGKQLYVFYGWKGAGDIYVSKMENGEYSKPEKLPNQVSGNSTYESSASVSFDGKELYFASTRPGGKGEEDIYFCTWDEKKKTWGEPQNLGDVINTKYRETGIFLHPDGETMYFASEGHESMGGFDIFMTKKANGLWSKPVNIGYPVNSTDDDVYFVVAGSARYGYYASSRADGLGATDIYRITFLGPEKQPQTSSEDNLLANFKPVREVRMEPKVEITTASLTILKGVIRDEKTQLSVMATIELVDNEKNEVLAVFSSDGKTGKYLVSIPSGKNYGIAVKSEGYLFHSENIDIPKASGYREYEKNIDLKKIDVGEIIVLRNIFFDFNKATLRSESANELQRLVKLMNDNPTLKIEISGHTDHQGSDEYNQKLSESRAESVVNYLIEKGVSMSRLEHKGYGESQPVISEDEISKMKTKAEKDEAHQQNRRTEFKILSK